jgi:ABC-type phosphate/phosphonate transport system ATPase subunit
MPCTSGVDPPRASADPRNYVPIVSSERALDALRENLRAGCPRIALQGPSGIGKTLLLRVLAACPMELRPAPRRDQCHGLHHKEQEKRPT